MNQVLEYTLQPSEGDSASISPFTVNIFLETVILKLGRIIEFHDSWIRTAEPPPAYRKQRELRNIEIQQIVARLKTEQLSGFPHIIWDESQADHIHDIVLGAVCDREFTTIFCHSCQQTYLPAQISVNRWSRPHGTSDSHGGREASCPAGHCLSHSCEWLT